MLAPIIQEIKEFIENMISHNKEENHKTKANGGSTLSYIEKALVDLGSNNLTMEGYKWRIKISLVRVLSRREVIQSSINL